VTAVVLKGHPSSRGTVRLTGSHPQDKLDIQKMHFQTPQGPQDVADLREGIKRARAIMSGPLVSIHVDTEVFPGPQAQTDDQIDAHVYENIFGERSSFQLRRLGY
jgi:choline dehydrogenase